MKKHLKKYEKLFVPARFTLLEQAKLIITDSSDLAFAYTLATRYFNPHSRELKNKKLEVKL